MRRAALGFLACGIKIVLWFRALPPQAHIVILTIALWLLVAVMFSILMERNERRTSPICWDRDQVQHDYQLCEFKLRNA